MAEIQKFFSSGSMRIEIPPGEYEGPLVIRHSCTVDGHGATLWTKNGAALIIDAQNVTIKNFRVELMTKTEEFVAIEVLRKDVRFENVEVYGNIRGSENAAEDWDLPRTIDFGNFAAGSQNEFSCRFGIRETCRVINSVYGLNISPQDFSPGEYDLRFTVSPMKDGMVLYGSFCLETANKVLRRIYVSGRAQSGVPVKNLPKVQPAPETLQATALKPPQQKEKPYTQPELPQKKKSKRRTSSVPISQEISADTERKFFPDPNFPQSKATNSRTASSRTQQIEKVSERKHIPVVAKMKRGQNVPAPNAENIEVIFKALNLSDDITIDAFAFCLGKNGKVQRDTDLIFFNNPRHESFGVSLYSREKLPGISLSLKDLPAEIQSVVIFFSIYDEGNRFENNFSNLTSPEVVVSADENVFCEFPVQLGRGKIFKALEIYRDKGSWKIHFVGLSSEEDFAKLCEIYGVEIF